MKKKGGVCKLQDDGSIDPNQEIEVVLKNEKAKNKKDLTLLVKRDVKKNPIPGMEFEIKQIERPVIINEKNEVEK